MPAQKSGGDDDWLGSIELSKTAAWAVQPPGARATNLSLRSSPPPFRWHPATWLIVRRGR